MIEQDSKTYVVVGATSDVGQTIAATLVAQGHRVRRVARSLGLSFDDRKSLDRAFAGADGAYLMIPFDKQAPDLHARERQVGEALANTVKAADIPRVVLLSGLNAHLKMGTSLGAAVMEERLDALRLQELIHLRAGFFMENFTKGMSFVEQATTGAFATPFRADAPMPLIAARDIGARVAALLTREPAQGRFVHELHGGGLYTFQAATAILGKTIGKPDLAYVQIDYSDARTSMIANGFSPSFADAVVETAKSFNEGERWGLEAPSPINATPTSLEQWAAEMLNGASAHQ